MLSFLVAYYRRGRVVAVDRPRIRKLKSANEAQLSITSGGVTPSSLQGEDPNIDIRSTMVVLEGSLACSS